MKRFAVLTLMVLPGCEDPSLNLGASISGNGVNVYPSVSGRVGGVGVAVSP